MLLLQMYVLTPSWVSSIVGAPTQPSTDLEPMLEASSLFATKRCRIVRGSAVREAIRMPRTRAPSPLFLTVLLALTVGDPDVATWAGMLVWPAIVCGVAWLAFRALRTEIRDLL